MLFSDYININELQYSLGIKKLGDRIHIMEEIKKEKERYNNSIHLSMNNKYEVSDNDYILSDFDTNESPSVYIRYIGTEAKLFARHKIKKNDKVSCINKINLLTNERTNIINIDDYQHSKGITVVMIKLGLCIEGVFKCDDLNVSQKLKKYFINIMNRKTITSTNFDIYKLVQENEIISSTIFGIYRSIYIHSHTHIYIYLCLYLFR